MSDMRARNIAKLDDKIAVLRELVDDWREQAGAKHREVERLNDVLRRIANMPIDPRPDGSYNYDRAAIIRMAKEAVGDE